MKSILATLGIVLIVLKLIGVITASWLLVLLPFFLTFVIWFVFVGFFLFLGLIVTLIALIAER